MGWLFYNRPAHVSVQDEIRRIFTSASEATQYEVLDVAVTLTVAYAAIRITKKATGASYVTAAVVLIKHEPKAKDGYNFGYKDMDESMGPVEDHCPRRILELLTPISDIEKVSGGTGSMRHANEWRNRCWARINAKKDRPPIRSGTRLELKEPIRFTDGKERRRFVAEKYGRQTRWVCMDTGASVKISKRVVDGGTLAAA